MRGGGTVKAIDKEYDSPPPASREPPLHRGALPVWMRWLFGRDPQTRGGDTSSAAHAAPSPTGEGLSKRVAMAARPTSTDPWGTDRRGRRSLQPETKDYLLPTGKPPPLHRRDRPPGRSVPIPGGDSFGHPHRLALPQMLFACGEKPPKLLPNGQKHYVARRATHHSPPGEHHLREAQTSLP